MCKSEELKKRHTKIYDKLSESGLGLTDEQIDSLTSKEIIDNILNWEGIIGYTDFIIETIDAAVDVSYETFEDLVN
jgi:hypothetical protein